MAISNISLLMEVTHITCPSYRQTTTPGADGCGRPRLLSDLKLLDADLEI
jgi:hypothetical protein